MQFFVQFHIAADKAKPYPSRIAQNGWHRQDEEELGDIFFMLVNLSRFLDVDPEEALRKTISKFIRRFRYIEESAADSGKSLNDMTLDEMEKLWQESKRE